MLYIFLLIVLRYSNNKFLANENIKIILRRNTLNTTLNEESDGLKHRKHYCVCDCPIIDKCGFDSCTGDEFFTLELVIVLIPTLLAVFNQEKPKNCFLSYLVLFIYGLRLFSIKV